MTPDMNEPKAPWRDPIVAEVRAAREQLLADAGFDLETLGRQLRESQERSGREVITLPPRRPGGRDSEAA